MSTLPKVAWIGLGIMGSPMAENLIKAGYSVTGFTLEQEKLDRLAANGGTVASSIAEAVSGADVVITMVPASPQVEAIAYGEDGILENAQQGALLIDMSSITPQTSIDLAEAAGRRASGSSTHRCPAARRGPSKRCSPSWSAVNRPTSTRPGRSSTRSAGPSSCAVRTARDRR